MIRRKTFWVTASIFMASVLLFLSWNVSSRADDKRAREGVSGSISLEVCDLHYRVIGDKGPYLVILSGGPGLDVDYMASITKDLAKSNRCILLEQRGTGRSKLKSIDKTTINWDAYLSDLEALRKHLNEKKLTLIGHSWGMAYALAYAGKYPDSCGGVVSVGSCPITAEYMQIFSENRMSRLHPSEREIIELASRSTRGREESDRVMYEGLRAITPTDFFDRKKGVAQALLWDKAWCHSDVNAVANMEIYRRLDLRPQLKQITCPVLLVHGRQDVTGEANMLEAKDSIKDCALVFVRRCGHYPWLDQPEETWKAVMPFLEKLSK
jgi:proline iminopeptidase